MYLKSFIKKLFLLTYMYMYIIFIVIQSIAKRTLYLSWCDLLLEDKIHFCLKKYWKADDACGELRPNCQLYIVVCYRESDEKNEVKFAI